MLEAQEDVFYYVTVTNENYDHPGIPPDASEGVLKGMYLLKKNEKAQVQLLGSGPILNEVIAAAALLEKDWGVAANVWSVTSFTELRRDGMRAERARRLGGKGESWVAKSLNDTKGPVIAASDYVSAVADLIRPYVPGKYVALGTDGYGRSDTRAKLRAFFEVDARSIAIAALAALGSKSAAAALDRYGVADAGKPAWER
jgi:pyruvate dehydrogenase E1 component